MLLVAFLGSTGAIIAMTSLFANIVVVIFTGLSDSSERPATTNGKRIALKCTLRVFYYLSAPIVTSILCAKYVNATYPLGVAYLITLFLWVFLYSIEHPYKLDIPHP
jgi:hypothetical protein